MYCRQNVNKNNVTVAKYANKVSLLEKTCDLIRNFSEYFDVVVSVARKTDGRHWADLFSAAGRSTESVFHFTSIFLFVFSWIILPHLWSVSESSIFRNLSISINTVISMWFGSPLDFLQIVLVGLVGHLVPRLVLD